MRRTKKRAPPPHTELSRQSSRLNFVFAFCCFLFIFYLSYLELCRCFSIFRYRNNHSFWICKNNLSPCLLNSRKTTLSWEYLVKKFIKPNLIDVLYNNYKNVLLFYYFTLKPCYLSVYIILKIYQIVASSRCKM